MNSRYILVHLEIFNYPYTFFILNGKKTPAALYIFYRNMESVLLTPSMLCIAGDFTFHIDLSYVDTDALSDIGKGKNILPHSLVMLPAAWA